MPWPPDPALARRDAARLVLFGLVLTFAASAAHADTAPQGALRQLGVHDVIVVGSEPEAVAAAVAAAEEGARTLLVTRDARLGGLFVLGELAMLDLRTDPVNYQQGLFERWWRRVGGGNAFDVGRAEAAFEAMLSEAGVEVRRGVGTVAPERHGDRVIGVRVDGVVHPAPQVIDGTADMDFAAAAGARWSFGFASIGYPQRMADTLVLRIDGVDWGALRRGAAARGREYARVDAHVAWGHFDRVPAAYRPAEPGLRLRGLNLARQDDGRVLVNALLIHGVDPFDPTSVAEGRARAEREGPRIVAYLRERIPGFADARYAGGAPELYVRETRHLEARCQLRAADLFDNRVTPRAVAAGGYPLDVQALTPHDAGYLFGVPAIYGVELCVTVPQGLDGLWVVGRSAGYDPLAASSARVVPFGMALAEAVGVAAAQAAADGVDPASLSDDPERIASVRARLRTRGAYLPPLAERTPVGPVDHPHYHAYRVMLERGLALGGYDNDPDLDGEVSALSFLYLLANVGQRFHGDPQLGRELLARYGEPRQPLDAPFAAEVVRRAACELGRCPAETTPTGLERAGLFPSGIPPQGPLSRGEAYALAARLAELGPPHREAVLP